MTLKIDKPRINKSKTELSVSYQNGNEVGLVRWYKKDNEWFLKYNNVKPELEKKIKEEMKNEGDIRLFVALEGFFLNA
ncbi:hypothetical protein ABEX78_23680 [Priestia megaterium]